MDGFSGFYVIHACITVTKLQAYKSIHIVSKKILMVKIFMDTDVRNIDTSTAIQV